MQAIASHTKKKKLKPFLIIAIILLVIALIAGAIYCFSQFTSSNTNIISSSSTTSDGKDGNSFKQNEEPDTKNNPSGYKRLYDYIIENGDIIDGIPHIIEHFENFSFIMATADDGSITWGLVCSTDEWSTTTKMQLKENSKTQDIESKVSLSNSDNDFYLYGSIITSEFSQKSSEIYDFFASTDLLDEQVLKSALEEGCKVMFAMAENPLKESGVSMSDLGFTSY